MRVFLVLHVLGGLANWKCFSLSACKAPQLAWLPVACLARERGDSNPAGLHMSSGAKEFACGWACVTTVCIEAIKWACMG
jgi:hypothetical protein